MVGGSQGPEAQKFPDYIRKIIDSYLSNRVIWYLGKNGIRQSRSMEAGVPQGSVLGPILWNIAFDSALELADDDKKSHIICYADDTLIIETERNLFQLRLRASVVATRVVNEIGRLGLSVATEKSEAMIFYDRGIEYLVQSWLMIFL